MKKEQLTQKQVKGMFNNVIKLGYCEIPTLLYGLDRTGYTAGMYGWNADVYMVGEVAIVTGYRPFGNIRPDFELVRKYEEKAKVIVKLNEEYSLIAEKLHKLLLDFINEVLEKGGIFNAR